MTPRGLEPQLVIKVTDESKKRDERKIAASVPPGAAVFVKTGSGGYERVPVSPAGKLTVTLTGREASKGELIAFDAAGRSAQLGGGSPEGVKAALAGAVEKPVEEAPEIPKPKEKRAAKEKEKTKRRRRLAPLEKPVEAKPPPLDDDEMPPVEDTLDGDDGPPPAKRTTRPEKKAVPTLKPINEDDEEKVD